MKVGMSVFCQNYYQAERPDHEVYRDDLALAELAEPLGFDSLWAVEHHFSNYTMIPDVVQFPLAPRGQRKIVLLRGELARKRGADPAACPSNDDCFRF